MAYVRKARVRKVPRRAYKKKAPKTVAKLSTKINALQKYLQPEKKITRINVFGQNFGQLNLTGGGYFTLDLTPNPIQASSENQKIGSSFKVTSFNMNCQILPMVNNTVGGWVYWEIYGINGYAGINYAYNTNPIGTAENPMELMYDVNPFITGATDAIIDVCSQKNPDFRSPFQLLRRGRVWMPSKDDSVNPTSRIKTFRIGHKFKTPREMVYNKNSTTIVKGSYFLALRSSVGNISVTASTCANVPSPGAQTGWTFSMAMNQFYIDV